MPPTVVLAPRNAHALWAHRCESCSAKATRRWSWRSPGTKRTCRISAKSRQRCACHRECVPVVAGVVTPAKRHHCQEAQAYADENGLFFMETSAKTANNVNGATRACAWARWRTALTAPHRAVLRDCAQAAQDGSGDRARKRSRAHRQSAAEEEESVLRVTQTGSPNL